MVRLVAGIPIYQKCIGWRIKADIVCMVLATLSRMHALSEDVTVDYSLVESHRKSWSCLAFDCHPKDHAKAAKRVNIHAAAKNNYS